MKFLLQSFLFSAVVAVEGASAKYAPTRITFADLVHGNEIGGDDVFWKSLREVGLLSVTDIPDFNKNVMLQDLEDCLHRQDDVGAPDFVLDHASNDGVYRRTLATRTLSGTPEGMLVATKSHKSTEKKIDASHICDNLQDSSEIFRNAVQSVSEAIASRFGSVPSLAMKGDDSGRKIPVQTLINEGEHLEHFHSYYSGNDETSSIDNETNIDWHTDQGMMLLFTPGQYQDSTTSGGFFIQLNDGSAAEVSFDSNIDDLVIMLGDGVNQYINDKTAPALRAVPHAVTLPSSQNPRLWYGRMVLPPPTAIHPSGKGSTFEDIRTAMIEGDRDALSLGCATPNISARQLVENTEEHGLDLSCDTDISVLCWMTCMTFEDFDVDVDACTSQSENHKVVCASEEGEIWDELGHDPAVSLRCLELTSSMDTDMEADMSESMAASFGAFRVVSGIVGILVTAMM